MNTTDESDDTKAHRIETDSMANALSGLGGAGDKGAANSVNLNARPMSKAEMSVLYRFNGFARRIVEAEADEALKSGFTVVVSSGESDPFTDAFNALKLEQALFKASTAARKFGGGAILIGADDGAASLREPLNLTTVRGLRFLVVADCTELQVAEYDRDIASDNFKLPLIYTYTPRGIGPSDVGATYQWHHTRVIRFDGLQLNPDEEVSNNGWGDSVLEACKQQIFSFSVLEQGISHLVNEYEVQVLGIRGLRDMAASPNGREAVRNRALLFHQTKGLARLAVLDADGETFNRSTLQASGIADLYDRTATSLAGAAKIPVSRLFGTPPKGLSTDDRGAMRSWYDQLSKARRLVYRPAILRICEVLRAAGVVRIPEDAKLDVSWPALEEPTETERADARLKNAQADEIHWRIGALDEIEVRQSAYQGAGVSSDRRLMSAEERAAMAGDAPVAAPPATPTSAAAAAGGAG